MFLRNDSSKIFCTKYHGLGNDYLVVDPAKNTRKLSVEDVKKLCHRNYGVGADGLLYGPINNADNIFSLEMYNPDGSIFEKSGNGLRIFARYLWDMSYAKTDHLKIQTKSGLVDAWKLTDDIKLALGKAEFNSQKIPVSGDDRDVLGENLIIDNETFKIHCVATGNPHCVIFEDDLSMKKIKRIGPLIETHPLFPNRINVQFAKVIDSRTIRIEIWERGAGYTLASGTSSSAVASVAYKMGLCSKDVSISMPGGTLKVNLDDDFNIHLTGPVTKVFEGYVSSDVFL